MAWHLTFDEETYEEACENFEWNIPEDYNIIHDVLRKHDDPKGSVALFQAYPDGRRETYTFHDLDILSSKLANGLEGLGVEEGDRVAIMLPQKPANPLTHLASWKMGAISLPLSVLFGKDALKYRLKNSGAKIVVVDSSVRDTVNKVKEECPNLENIIEVDGESGDAYKFEDMYEGESRHYEMPEMNQDTPGIIIYTSGSTGPPKGTLHTQGVWLGHCPAFYMYFERNILGELVSWTPADWAWIGGLGDIVFTSWHYGRPIVGYPMGKFNSEESYEIMEEFGVTGTFLPASAIRMMMEVDNPTEKYDLDLEIIASGGESLTPEIYQWAEKEFEGLVVNEFYGQTEANLLVSNCHDWFDHQPGSTGKPVPGHKVGIVDSETGEEKERGEIAVRHDNDPVIFKEYWKEPEKTENARIGDWHLTGDLGKRDEDGYIWFASRKDDVIITSGYRVGPGEVESVILEHEGAEHVAVIGVPDETRGEIIKAFVVVAKGVDDLEKLREEIQELVRDKLAKYEYPREVEFIDELPRTTTGKIQRTKLRELEKEK